MQPHHSQPARQKVLAKHTVTAGEGMLETLRLSSAWTQSDLAHTPLLYHTAPAFISLSNPSLFLLAEEHIFSL